MKQLLTVPFFPSRQRIVGMALGLILGLTLGFSPSARAERQVWVAYGDSITHSEAFAPTGGSWRHLVAAASGNTVIDAGNHGASTEQALLRLYSDVLIHKPDLVIVMFGINDQIIHNGTGPGAFRVPPIQFAWNLQEMISQITRQGAKVALMTNRPLVQGPGITGENYFFNRQGNRGSLYPQQGGAKATIRAYNDIIRKLAAKNGTMLIDFWQAVVDKGGGSDSDAAIIKAAIDRPGRAMDGVHLGPGGHTLLAQEVLKVLAPGASPPQ